MNLLSNVFDTNRIDLMEVNKKYMFILIIIISLTIISLLFIEKNYYYTNTITNVGDNIVLVVEKEMVSNIKNNKKIIIDDIENDYSINKIEVLQDICFVYININNKNIQSNTYKINIGKESVLDYIIRTLKN